MSLEEQFREQIIKQFPDKYVEDIHKVPMRFVSALPLDEMAQEGTMLETLCEFMGRLVYAVKKGTALVMLLCALIEAPGLTVQVPSSHDVVSQFGDRLRAGETEIVQMPEYKINTFFVFRPNWINDRDLYDHDHIEIEKGDLSSLYALDALLSPATGTAASVASGTTAVPGYVSM